MAAIGWHNLERISKGDFHRLHIAFIVLARMSSDASEEPPPKGHAAHLATLQRVLELSCVIVRLSVCKAKLDHLEPEFYHESFGSGGSPVASLEHRPVFRASPLPCVAVHGHGTPFRGPPESFQVAAHV